MTGQKRFSLERGKWYAVDFIADDVSGSMEGGYGYSPIYVWEVKPRKSGDSLFDLEFFHANYPQGVNSKEYTLKTVHRGETFILARTTDHHTVRFLCIHELTENWARKHFTIDADETIERWLERNGPSAY